MAMARHMDIRVALLALGLQSSSCDTSVGGLVCFHEGWTAEFCCDKKHGPRGNRDCWDQLHNYKDCCLVPQPSTWDAHIAELEERWDADTGRSDIEEITLEDVDWIVVGSGSGGSI